MLAIVWQSCCDVSVVVHAKAARHAQAIRYDLSQSHEAETNSVQRMLSVAVLICTQYGKHEKAEVEKKQGGKRNMFGF
jgi:hypothetical protein